MERDDRTRRIERWTSTERDGGSRRKETVDLDGRETVDLDGREKEDDVLKIK
ncbi:hypothetical protein F2Q69_00007352 [Brassica cretica]|uniref:Uncharacterized protein n=1 Tax=Brassica cretica TaxID=69181 RepID=A0A8S9PDR5_BRACR|nr:hypothetical protein F2Q69_00007352 [Brassica cretica]